MDNSEQSIPRLRGRREKGGAEPGLAGLHHPGLVRHRGLVTGLVHGLHVIGQGGLLGGGKVTLAALVRFLTGMRSDMRFQVINVNETLSTLKKVFETT